MIGKADIAKIKLSSKTSHQANEEKKIKPTNKQAQASLRVCQMLSNGYKDIHLFRFDEKTGDVFVLAGKDIQIVIPQNGEWYFL